MSSLGPPPAPLPFDPSNGAGRRPGWLRRSGRRGPWLPAALFLATFLTTTAMGARLALNFHRDLPAFADGDFRLFFYILEDPAALAGGLPFSLTLLAILMAHELGHYFACRYYRVEATLPYFLPAPTLIGTLGAFIRIRSPIYTRRALFDIGVAGPLAGFFLVLPAFAVGLAWSKIIPGIAGRGELIFGAPPVQHLLSAMIFPGIPSSDIYLHPVARAAWVGVLATALNLLPIGQLDGGHILYSFAGRRHKLLSRLFVFALVPLGIFYSPSWLVWAAILLLLGMRHPSIYDAFPLGPGRRALGVAALAIFLLSFSVTPVRLANGF